MRLRFSINRQDVAPFLVHTLLDQHLFGLFVAIQYSNEIIVNLLSSHKVPESAIPCYFQRKILNDIEQEINSQRGFLCYNIAQNRSWKNILV